MPSFLDYTTYRTILDYTGLQKAEPKYIGPFLEGLAPFLYCPLFNDNIFYKILLKFIVATKFHKNARTVSSVFDLIISVIIIIVLGD